METHFFIFGLFFLAIIEAVTVDQKSSLLFVIDDTGSMQVDVHELNKTAKSIFDKVNSDASHIDDFIVVTFNDPEVKLRNNEHSKSEFETALSDIEPRGGGNCAEMSLSGIQLGLEKGRAGSLLWVFTDASAADMEKYYKVEELSQKLGSQVYFAVTGLCDNRTNPDFLVYRDLAMATNGQVFHLRKNEIGQIFKYVELLIGDRKDIVTSKMFRAGGLNQFHVNVDADMEELIIAVSGENPVVKVTSSTGVLATTDVIRLGEIAVVTVQAEDPGVYKVEVTSNSETHVVVSASTSLHFEHGFSVFSSSNINATTRKPVPETQSHLSIQLATEDPDAFDVRSVQILDMDDKVILEEPLELVNKVTQFYTTKKISPPNDMFKVAVKMYDTVDKTYITRHGLTPIKPQNRTTGDHTEKALVVTIEGGSNINAAFYHPLQLRCKIKGYPKPDVMWMSSDMSANLTYDKQVSIFELPEDYISVLDIAEVKNNASYTCSAVNSIDSKNATVFVQTQAIIVATPIELPENATIEYLKVGRIACKVETFPFPSFPFFPKVTWHKNGKPLKPDGNLEVSEDGSVLTIRSMEPYMADSYNCSVENALLKKVYPFQLSISGLEPPTLMKINPNKIAMKNSKVDLKCSVTAGIPVPSISWFYKNVAASEFTNLNKNIDTMHFDAVDVTNAGSYICLAENIAGSDSIKFELTVKEKCLMPQEIGPCRASITKWYYDSDLKKCSKFYFGGCLGNENNFETEAACQSECSAIVTTQPPPIGKCEQPMKVGPCLASIPRWYYDTNRNECIRFRYGGCQGNKNNFNWESACRSECSAISTTQPPPIERPAEKEPEATIEGAPTIIADYYKPLKLKCIVSGWPKPDVIWKSDDSKSKNLLFTKVSIIEIPYKYISVLEVPKVTNNVTYTCEATNSVGGVVSTVTVQTVKKNFIEVEVEGDHTEKALVVTIEGGSNINAAFYHPLQLRCKIKGYPKPDVMWMSSDMSANLTYDKQVSIFELPEDYISVLDIAEVKNNASYTCSAVNSIDSKNATVFVQTQAIIVATPIELPENATIQYLKAGRIACKVETFPLAKVTWHKNGKPLKPDGNLEVSDDGSVLTIRSMEPYMADSYNCSVENALLKKVYPFKLSISGLEPPTLMKINPNKIAMKNSKVDLKCSVTAGIPVPSFSWFYKDVAASEFTNLNKNIDTMQFDAVDVTNAGSYICLAENIAGSDSIKFELTVKEKCLMPQEIGPCRASITKWYYDSDLKKCSKFYFGGCLGNENNFETEAACQSECSAIVTTQPPPIGKCEQPMKVGPCRASIPRWYYDTNLNECIRFEYGGCQGNKNNFNWESACRSECSAISTTQPPPIAKCEQPMKVGPCRASIPKWYYDTNLNKCIRFEYGGCQGNENNFNSESACRSECSSISTTQPPPIGKCEQPMKVGPCRASIPRWYYDTNLNECIRFEYGGCQGNENNFNSESACRSECSAITIVATEPPPDKCQMPKETGPCRAFLKRWFYDINLKECRKFYYGGCKGNENKFDSEAACRAECAPATLAPFEEYNIDSDTTAPSPATQQKGCLLDITRDLNGNDPLMLTQNDEFTNFHSSEGNLQIPENQTIKLVCPVKFNKFILKEIIVTCESGKQFLHQSSGRHYQYSDLKCTDQWQYKNIKTGRQCLNVDSELLNVGFEIRGRFQEIYQVCLNQITNNPFYIKHNLVQGLPNAVSNKDTPWFDSENSVDLDVTFDCDTQNGEISRTLNKEFRNDGCCFAKRMLVNPLDVAPGSAQKATYSYLNIAPHWSSCNSQNWEAIEQRIRDFRMKLGRPLQVWTGVTQHLQIADASSELQNITLSQSGKQFQVPKYFWKVVQDPGTNAALAIVQVNIPDLQLRDALKHRLCPDVCRKTTWMNSGQWRSPARGYTYCCDLEKFKSAFQLAYYGVLPTSQDILLDATTLPDLVV